MGTEAGLRELGTSRVVPIGTKARSKLIKKACSQKPSGVLQGRRTERHRADCLGTSRVVPMGTEARTARNDQSESRGTDTRSVRIGNHVLAQIPKQVR